jgi:MbtH protein
MTMQKSPHLGATLNFYRSRASLLNSKREAHMSIDDPDTTFRVVMNDEEQYSIWPSYRPVPDGWRDTGFAGKRAECLAYIDEIWTDMRPLSLRKFFAGA